MGVWRCQICRENGSYGHRGADGKPTVVVCREHKADDMISLRSTTCEDSDCRRRPSYGFASEKKKKFCTRHAKDRMTNLQRKHCIAIGCVLTANFGYGRELTHCHTHGEGGMTGPRGQVITIPRVSADARVVDPATAAAPAVEARMVPTASRAVVRALRAAHVATIGSSGSGGSRDSTPMVEQEGVKDKRKEVRQMQALEVEDSGSLAQPAVEESPAAEQLAQRMVAEEPATAEKVQQLPAPVEGTWPSVVGVGVEGRGSAGVERAAAMEGAAGVGGGRIASMRNAALEYDGVGKAEPSMLCKVETTGVEGAKRRLSRASVDPGQVKRPEARVAEGIQSSLDPGAAVKAEVAASTPTESKTSRACLVLKRKKTRGAAATPRHP